MHWDLRIFISIALLPLNSLQLRALSSDPVVVVYSFLLNDSNGAKREWKKFADLKDEAKSDLVEVFDGGFVFFNVNEVEIHCEAPYPVEWQVENALEVPVESYSLIQTYTKRNGPLHLMTPDMWNFTAVLKLNMPQPFASGNYTCRGLNSKSHRQTTTFIYLSAQGQSLLAETGQTFDINASGKSLVILPCRLTQKDDNIPVLLQKKLERDDMNFTWTLVNESIAYDSRVGFSLTVQDIAGIVGEYRCVVNGTEINDGDAVHFRISNNQSKTVDVKSPRRNLQGTSAIWWDVGKNRMGLNFKEYFCCSNSTEPPEFLVIPCSNPADCNYIKLSVFASEGKFMQLVRDTQTIGSPTANCSRQTIYDPIFITRCKGDGIDVFQTYYFTFRNANVVDLNDHGESFNSFGKHDIELIPVPTSKPVVADQEKMIDMVYFQSKRAKRLYGEMETIQVGGVNANDFAYTGVTVTFRCYYSTYMFAQGGYWKVKWKNGDTALFPDGSESEFSSVYRVIQPNGILTLTMKLEKEMESVACGCSVFNTSEWKFRETKISVKDPVKPTFIIDKEEVSWVLHSKNGTLTCEVSGAPVPTWVTWRKDGMEILDRHTKQMRIEIETDIENRKSVLLVPEVSYEMHGKYSCVMKNVGGTAEKVFNVNVKDGTSFVRWAIFGVGLSLLILGGIGIVVWKIRSR